jgi:hypothetical protein
MTPWRSLGSFTGPFKGYAPKPGVDHIALPIAALVPKAGVLFPLKAPSGHKRSCFVDNDEERLDQDGRILVYHLVYFAQALASQTKQTFSAALMAIWKRVPWGQRATVRGPRATPRGG